MSNAENIRIEIILGKSDFSQLDALTKEALEKILKSAKIKVVIAPESEDSKPKRSFHTEEELRAMFPAEMRNSPASQMYMKPMLEGYRLLCLALEKGGYSVEDYDVAMLLTNAGVMENIPNWRGIQGTEEGENLNKFLDQFRVESNFGMRIKKQRLKSWFGGLPGRLVLNLRDKSKPKERPEVGECYAQDFDGGKQITMPLDNRYAFEPVTGRVVLSGKH